MRRVVLALAAAAVVAGSLGVAAPAQERREVPPFQTFGEPARAEDAAAVDAFIEQFLEAWAAEDVDALMALHAEDVEWINAYARIFRGSEALGAFLKDILFPMFDPGASEREAGNMKRISIRYIGDDVAVAHLYTDGPRGPSRNEGEQLRRTHLHLVLERDGEAWKIAHTAIMDAR